MSIARMSGVWEESQLGGTDLLVLLALADFADDDGFCWPSAQTLATKGRISRRQIFRVLHTLADDGEVFILSRSGPRSNGYVILIGNSRSAIDRSLIRAGKFGVGKSELESKRAILAELDAIQELKKAAQSNGDNLSPSESTTPSGDTGDIPPTDRGDTGDTPNGDTGDTRSVSESSEEHDPPESAAEAAPESDAEWLEESRINGESQLETMTPEQRAEVGAPGGSTDLRPDAPPGDPRWAKSWRELLRPRYQYGLTMTDMIPWTARFADPNHADVPVPTDRGGAADWHGGALAFHRRVAEDLDGQMSGYKIEHVQTLTRRAMFCLDLFFWRRDQGHSYYQHEVTRPASLSNKTVVALARDLRKMQDQFDLNLAVMPTQDKMERFYDPQGEKAYDQRQLTEEDRERIKRTIVRGESVREPTLDLLGQQPGQEAGAQRGPVDPG